MKEFLTKNKNYITVIVLLMVIVAIASFGIPFLIKRLNSKSDQIHKLILDQEISSKMLMSFSDTESDFEKMKTDSSGLMTFFSEDKTVFVAQDLEKIAQETNNEINISVSSTPSAATKGKKTDSKEEVFVDLSKASFLALDVELIGTYQDSIRFLQRLKGLGYYHDVVALSMESGGSEEEQGKLISEFYDKRAMQGTVTTEVEGEAQEEIVAVESNENIIKSGFKIIFYLNSEDKK